MGEKRIYCGQQRGIYCGEPVVGENHIYCGQHVVYILWVTHNIYVFHPQHIRVLPTSVTHNIINIILWVTYVYIVDTSMYILWVTYVYIVGNTDIYCG